MMFVLMDINVEVVMQQLCCLIFDCWGKIDLWVYLVIYVVFFVLVLDMLIKDFDKFVEMNIWFMVCLIQYVE